MNRIIIVIIISSWVSSLIANGLIYSLYFNPVTEAIVFGKKHQSPLFLLVWNNPELNKYLFATGLVFLSAAWGILYHLFHRSVPGTGITRDINFGILVIFMGHYLQQEFYTPLMLLREPFHLFLLQLVLLILACSVHGIVLGQVYHRMNAFLFQDQ